MGRQPPPAKSTPSSASKRKKRTAQESPPSLEAPDSSHDHSTTRLTPSHTNLEPGQENGNEPGASFNQTGVLEKAPVQSEVETVPSLPLSTRRLKPKKPLTPLRQVKIKHGLLNQARIDALCDQEQKTVTVDGGNTADSQLRVLDAIELLPFLEDQDNRIWVEKKRKGGDGKRKTAYYCSQSECGHHDLAPQKARQHFVSCHVKEAGWACPIEGCGHDHQHKRLDDLKAHHMVPDHEIKYYRGRGSVARIGDSEAGRSHLSPTRPSNPTDQDSGHTLGPHRTSAEGTRKGRHARLNSGPLNVRRRPRRDEMAPTTREEHHSPQTHVNEILSPSMNRSPVPGGLNFPNAAHADAFSHTIAPSEGTSPSNPIFARDFPIPSSSELQHPFPPSSDRRSQFDDHTRRQPPSLSQGEYYSLSRALNLFEMEGSSPAGYASTSSQHPPPGTHVSEQDYQFSVYYAQDDEIARMRMRDGLPGHDPPQQGIYRGQEDRLGGDQDTLNNQAIYMDGRVSNSPVIPPTSSPYAQRHQQSMAYGGPGSSHASPSHVGTSPMSTHSYATTGSPLHVQLQSWPSYLVDGSNVHDYGQPSTSYGSPQRLTDPSSSFHVNRGYPPPQMGSGSHGAFALSSPQASSPNREDEHPPYDDSNFNPDDGHFNHY